MTFNSLKIGAFGTGNLGDDLMLQAILQNEPNANVVAYGRPNLPFTIDFILNSDFVKRSEHYISMSKSLDFGGGNLFWSLENISDMLIFTQQAKLASIPVNLNRIGLQGYERNENYAKKLLKLVDTISVRDSESLRIASHLGRSDCSLISDYALELKYPKVSSNNNYKAGSKKKIGINFSDWRFTSVDPIHRNFCQHIAGIFSELARQFNNELEFYYIPFCIHRSNRVEDDLRAAAILWEFSGGLIKYCNDINNTNNLLDVVETMDVLLGKRFHMQVLGKFFDKLVIPMVVDVIESSKYSAFAYDNSIKTIPYEGFSQEFIIDQIKNVLNRFLNAGDNKSIAMG